MVVQNRLPFKCEHFVIYGLIMHTSGTDLSCGVMFGYVLLYCTYVCAVLLAVII